MFFTGKKSLKSLFIILTIGVSLAAISILGSCAKQKDGEPVIFSGKTFSQAEVRQNFSNLIYCGKAQYAEINIDWLKWAYEDFRAELSQGRYGITDWSNRSQCTLFATSFESFCQRRFLIHGWNSRFRTPQIAIGTIWYLPNPNDAQIGHAINVALTTNGRQWFDPQSGKFIKLTDEQIATIYFTKFD